MERSVQAANGTRRKNVGRHPTLPSEPNELLCALDALCDKWERWCATAAAESKIPRGLKAIMDRATDAVGEVRRRIAYLQSDEGVWVLAASRHEDS